MPSLHSKPWEARLLFLGAPKHGALEQSPAQKCWNQLPPHRVSVTWGSLPSISVLHSLGYMRTMEVHTEQASSNARKDWIQDLNK